MPAGDGSTDEKKFVVSLAAHSKVLFDTSKKEMLNPNQGYKKIVQKLKTRYKVGTKLLILRSVKLTRRSLRSSA